MGRARCTQEGLICTGFVAVESLLITSLNTLQGYSGYRDYLVSLNSKSAFPFFVLILNRYYRPPVEKVHVPTML